MLTRDDARLRARHFVRRSLLGAALLAPLAAAALWTLPAVSGEEAVQIPAPLVDEPAQTGATSETAVLAGGCFWGVQGVFQHVKGVTQAVSGYSGGSKATADYETVSSGRTGHAESVEVTFDPSVISYGKILQIYFSVVQNPTELNRQGPDYGTQYRSAIFVKNAEQRHVADAYIAQLDKAHVFKKPIVTKVTDFTAFYPAEPYHQNYATIHPDNPYIAFNDLPKIAHLKTMFPAAYRSDPVLVSLARPQG